MGRRDEKVGYPGLIFLAPDGLCAFPSSLLSVDSFVPLRHGLTFSQFRSIMNLPGDHGFDDPQRRHDRLFVSHSPTVAVLGADKAA